MSDTVVVPTPAKPTPLARLKTWASDNVAVLVLGAGMAYYVYHDQVSRPTQTLPVFATEAKAYRDSIGVRFADTAAKIRTSELNNKKDIVEYLAKNAEPMAQAIDSLIDANVDKSNGNITNRPLLIEGFNAAAVNLGAKAK